jgi:hypothetical protein
MVGNLRKVESDGDPIHASLYAAWKVFDPHYDLAKQVAQGLQAEARKRGVYDHAIALAKGSMS